MMNIDELAQTYRANAQQAQLRADRLQQKIYRVSSLRLLLFVAGVAGLIYFRAEVWTVLTGIVLVTLVPFLALVKYHDLLFKRKAYAEKEAEVNRQELAALDYDTSGFDDGAEYADPAHLFACDLDVFGPHSLFQYINRTCTHPGKQRLAGWLSTPLEDAKEIVRRQEAVRELTPETGFRQRFRILGLLHKGAAADENELNAWANGPTLFLHRPLLRMLPYVVGGINVICLILVVTGMLSGSTWAVLWTCFALISFCFTGRITRVQAVYGKKLQILGTYARLLRLMDEQPLQCSLLNELRNDIGGKERRASESIRRLDKLMNELDQRNNYLMYFVLNGCFFWELWQIGRIEAWKEKHAEDLPRWLAGIGQMDALCSLATFAYNHPDYAYPTFADRPFCLRAERMGHPLMHRERCVRNDVDIPSRPYFLIITGANMAGKSTYLRTIGVNYLLGCTGMPVCAERMELYPARLVTSLRTTDSLTDNESYFFAELKRLKLIIDLLQSGETLFIILDEILKGTNSIDKQKGSMALIKQLMELKADGIIATHDLMLGSLVELFPENIRNLCFEADITDNELTFSYRLRPGIAQNMNACFLMKKMGIVVSAD